MRPLSMLLAFGTLSVASRITAQHTTAAAAPASLGHSSIAGTVFDSLVSNRPLAAASVWLVGTTYATVTDGRGGYRFDSLPPGPYTISFAAAPLESLGVSAPAFEVVTAAGDAVVVSLATPSRAAFYASVCGSPTPADAGVVLGIVRGVERGAPVAGAEVSAEWGELRLDGDGASHRGARVTGTSDPAGQYRLCGVPPDIPIVLHARNGLAETGNVGVRLEGQYAFAVRELVVAAAPPAVPAAPLIAAAADERATLVGRVMGAAGEPVNGATVGILGEGGQTTLTDSAGGFRFAGLPAGEYTVEARAIGYSPVRSPVSLRAGETVRVTVSFAERVVVLSPRTVVAEDNSSLLARTGFLARRKRGIGYFLTAEDIVRRNIVNLSDVLRLVPGLTEQWTGDHYNTGDSYSVRSQRGGNRCAPKYYVDGTELSSEGSIKPEQILRARDVQGLEVYGSGAVPPEFARYASCGVILIWTRDRLPDADEGRPDHE